MKRRNQQVDETAQVPTGNPFQKTWSFGITVWKAEPQSQRNSDTKQPEGSDPVSGNYAECLPAAMVMIY